MQNIVPLMPNQELSRQNTWQQAVEPTTTTPNEHLQQVQRQAMPPPESPPDRQVPRRRMSDRQVSDSVRQRQPASEERSNTTTLTCSVASETSHGHKCNTTPKQPLQGNGVQKTSKKCKSCDKSFIHPNRDSIGVQAMPLSTTIQRLTSGGGDHYNRRPGAVITADI